MLIDPSASPVVGSAIANEEIDASRQPRLVEARYSRASRSVYGCGTWSSQRAISASEQPETIAATSPSVHSRRTTVPSASGESGGKTRTGLSLQASYLRVVTLRNRLAG